MLSLSAAALVLLIAAPALIATWIVSECLFAIAYLKYKYPAYYPFHCGPFGTAAKAFWTAAVPLWFVVVSITFVTVFGPIAELVGEDFRDSYYWWIFSAPHVAALALAAILVYVFAIISSGLLLFLGRESVGTWIAHKIVALAKRIVELDASGTAENTI